MKGGCSMILLRKLYCVGCRKNTLHIIFCQKQGYNYYLTAVCLDGCCNDTRYITISRGAFLELCERTREDNPTSEGGI